jgi:hypothetical protein
MKETFEYIDLISQTIDKTIKIKSVVVNLDNTIDLQVNKTLWLTISNRPIVIDNVEYKIKSIVNNALIKLEPNLTPVVATEFQAYDFYYFHGTLTEVNIELNQIADSFLKFPMLYLVEVLEEENNTNDIEVVQRRVNARLLFATETDYVNNDTDGLYSTGIYPVRNFVNEFIYACENSPYINDLPDSYRSIPLTRIARYDANGHVSKLVNSQLTGIELRIELPLTDCECCDVQPTTLALQGNENIFLTCGTLADCPIIETIGDVLEDHEERIEALEEVGSGLTCETLPNCQVIQDIENEFGNYLPLVGGQMDAGAQIQLTDGGDYFSSIGPQSIGLVDLSNNKQVFVQSNAILISNGLVATIINTDLNPTENVNIGLPQTSGTLALLSDITTALIGYATQAWVNSQGFITNVITALGYTPENVSNKATNLTSPDNIKYPTTQAVADGLSSKKNITLKSSLNVTHTGTTDNTTIDTIAFPALTDNKVVRLEMYISRPASQTSAATVRVNVGGAEVITATVGTANRQTRHLQTIIVPDATGVVPQIYWTVTQTLMSTGTVNGANGASNINYSSASNIEVQVQLGTLTDTVILRFLSIDII